MIGRSLAHYQITAAIGAGGMGEVFRATDTKLGRAVALKVLPHEMARDPDRLARFQREARAVAALNHPHIVTIYSVEESDGLHFLTMELIEGPSLAHLIPEGGAAVDRILSTGIALADALAAAHDKGIVHRDLKPANVMMTTDGRLKVLDFGLAKELQSVDGAEAMLTRADHTEVGVVMGTPAYMSPEQIAGRPVDQRTDVFSLGVILYQMAAGLRPFEGSTSIELASSILRDTPRPLTDVRSDLPADLVRLIRRCLEKDPQRRVQTTRDVGNELREIARSPARESGGGSTASPKADAARDEGFWTAVLPFKYRGAHAELEPLAESLSEEIVTGLSRFSYLRVIARGSTLKYANGSADIRAIAKELGARYVMEGGIRQAGSTIRVAVQLVDAASGAHLWAETYDRQFEPNQLFALQDDLVPRIVSTVADAYGVLPHTMSQAVRRTPSARLTPYEALLRSFSYAERVTAEEHAEAKAGLERAVEQSPGHSDCWAMLSIMLADEYGHGFGVQPGTLDRALDAAQRAVDANPANHRAYQALAWTLFLNKQFHASRHAGDRALSLNPMDACTAAYVGQTLAYSGEWERGVALIARATQLNPNHPGWYWYGSFLAAYRVGEYSNALSIALKMNLPGVPLVDAALAATYGQLGDREAARRPLRDLIARRPDYGAVARAELSKWFDDDTTERLIDGLRKAGLDAPSAVGADAPVTGTGATTATGASDSGALRARDGFWVAVLPFKHAGTDANLAAFADGLSEEIATGLSRFSYLRVIARGSGGQDAGESGGIGAIGAQLGARYLIEGSIRQAGSSCRVAVQLVDVVSGAHLWAETFDRTFRPEEIFALQDQLVPRIVSTVADQHGVLVHSMSALIRKKSDTDVNAYEAVLRVFGFHERMTPDEHVDVRAILERVVEQSPDEGDCWAMLATLYTDEHMFGFNMRPDPLGRAQAAARRAVELSPASALASQALAQSLFFRKELQAFGPVAERTIALNPMDGATKAFIGLLLALSGDWERGCAAADAAMKLNPHFPGWYWLTPLFHAYHSGDYRGAVACATRINIPGYFWTSLASAAAYGQLGESDAAQKALGELLRIRPDFAACARDELGKWFQPDLLEKYLDGLRKAGLDV